MEGLKMIKVSPYIETVGAEKFKNFILQPFSVESMAYFDGWRGKDMGTWHKFTNEEGVVLEFYSDIYITKISKRNIQQTTPIPLTINDFINDMKRHNVQLYWNESILDILEPKEFLHKDEIRKYFADLLTKMEKGYELK